MVTLFASLPPENKFVFKSVDVCSFLFSNIPSKFLLLRLSLLK